MMPDGSNLIYFPPAERVSSAGDRFPPIMAQEDIDAQEADEKRRALYHSIVSGTLSLFKAVAIVIGCLGLLGFIVGG